jgi:hypothetical protein
MVVCLLMLMVRDDCLFVDDHLSPLPSINKQSSLTINIINKQSSHHHHQQTNNHLSLLPSTNKQSSLTITGERIVCLLMLMARDDCLFVGGNGER